MDKKIEALRSAIDPYTYANNSRWYRDGSFEFSAYSDDELDESQEHFGDPFPAGYRYVLKNYNSLVTGERTYCTRQGSTSTIYTTGLHLPYRKKAAEPMFAQWFRQVEDDLGGGVARHLIPRIRRFLPLASAVDGVRVGFDLQFEAENPPVVAYHPIAGLVCDKYYFLADDLCAFFRLPMNTDEAPPPSVSCTLSPRAVQWYEQFDELIDRIEMPESMRERCVQARTGR